jgi:serine/threonine-protein kinase
VQISAQLNHPNIIPIYDADLDPQRGLYVIMKLASGRELGSLRDELAGGAALSPEHQALVLDKFTKVLDALDYTHQKGIYHLDLKPGNVMALDNGGVYLMDYGLARIVTRETPAPEGGFRAEVAPEEPLLEKFGKRIEARAFHAPDGGIRGSLAYMAPEVVSQDPNFDHRADIYSAGIMMYELMTGQTPFKCENLMAAVFSHTARNPPDPLSIDPGIDPELARIAMKAINKDPADRYQSAAEFAADLRAALGTA